MSGEEGGREGGVGGRVNGAAGWPHEHLGCRVVETSRKEGVHILKGRVRASMLYILLKSLVGVMYITSAGFRGTILLFYNPGVGGVLLVLL